MRCRPPCSSNAMSKFLTMKLVKLNLASSKSSLLPSTESGWYTRRNENGVLRSATNVRAAMESLSLSTIVRRSHTSLMSNFPPYSGRPAFTPLIIIPAISPMSLSGYLLISSCMSSRHPSLSPLLSLLSPPMNMNLSRLAPSGKRDADNDVLTATSSNLSALKALYVAA